MHDEYPYITRKREVVSDAIGDVTGDGRQDYVFLTALTSLDPSSAYVTEIRLNIKDGHTNEIQTITLNKAGNAGYQPTVLLKDVTGDGIKDIIIRIDSGGSGAITYDYIYSFAHQRIRLLFDFEQYNQENQYFINYLDHYLVSIESVATEKLFLMTIINRSLDYLKEIYDKDGYLKKPIQGMADGISGFYPVDLVGNGVYQIQTYQRISGLYHADGFGYMINTLEWNGHKFVIGEQWFALFGETTEIS